VKEANSLSSAVSAWKEKHEPQINELTYTLLSIKKSALALTGIAIVVFLILIAILAPLIAPYPADVERETHLDAKFLPMSLEHPFGTDSLGRDILSRVLYGTRISLMVGILVVMIALVIGVPLGGMAGYLGGSIDDVIMRTTDMFLSFPPLLLPLAISAALGPNLTNAMIAVAVTWWPWYTRIIRGQALSIRERSFVEIARSIGVKDTHIILRHILPNTLPPVIVQASMDVGYAILTTAGLSFLGAGAQPPTPEWGLMVASSRIYFLQYWWTVAFPGLAIFASVLGFNLLGDGLRDVLDPKLRR
jgi:peptide/nickel transport system permease protein